MWGGGGHWGVAGGDKKRNKVRCEIEGIAKREKRSETSEFGGCCVILSACVRACVGMCVCISF